MSLESLFCEPEKLIVRFRHRTLFSRAFWVYLLIIMFFLLLIYLLITHPAFLSISAALLVVVFWVFNNMYDALLLIKTLKVSFHIRDDLYERVDEIKKTFCFNKPLIIHITNCGLEVKITSIFGKNRLMVGTGILDKGINNRDLDFLIAREITIYKIKKIYFSVFSSLLDEFERLTIFNPFLYTFERASFLTAERIASLFIGSHEYCKNMILASISNSNDPESANVEFSQTTDYHNTFFSWLSFAFSKRPSPQKRISEIEMFYERFKVIFLKRHESDGHKNTRQQITIKIC